MLIVIFAACVTQGTCLHCKYAELDNCGDIILAHRIFYNVQRHGSLKCYCDENFVFSFPVFLALISYLDPSLLESVKFSTS